MDAEPAAPRAVRNTVLAVVLAGVGWLAVFPLLGRLPTRGDLGDWHVPTRAFYADCLAHGESPNWFPHALMGCDLHGEGQVGICHPFHQLIYRVLHFADALNVEIVSAYLALLLGTFWWLRRLRLGAAPAWLGAFLFAFGGFCTRHYEHVNAMATIAHYPWSLLAIHLALRGSSPRRRCAGGLLVAAVTTSALLVGYPQYLWISGLLEGAYALFLAREREVRRRLLPLLAWKVLGVFGGAVQLLPTYELLQFSVRRDTSAEYRDRFPWHPIEILDLLSPFSFESGDMYPYRLHPGAVTLVLAVYAVAAVRRTRRVLVLGAASIALVSAVLALGRLGVLYRLHGYLPVVGTFRCPYRYLVVTEFCAAVLAALAVGDLLGRRRDPLSARSLRPLALLPVLALVAWGCVRVLDALGTSFYVNRHATSFLVSLAGPLSIAAATALVWFASRGRTSALAGLALLAAADLFAYDAAADEEHVPVRDYVAALPEPPPLAPGERVVAAVANQMVLRDVRSVGGYMQLRPERTFEAAIDEWGERSVAHLRLATVRWVQAEPVGEDWSIKSRTYRQILAQSRDWHESPDPLPRARLVAEAVVAAEPDEAIARVDVARVAVVEEQVTLDGGEPGRAVLAADRPGVVDVDVAAAGRQLLVVAESFHPGWRCEVDGASREVLRTHGAFLGVLVGPGDRRVELRFAPAGFELGWKISLASAGLGLAIALWVVIGGVLRKLRRRDGRIDGPQRRASVTD
jgi:hypothetical protein